MVLKIWPPDGPNQNSHRERHAKLRALESFRPALALPIADLDGNTVRQLQDGRFAELFQWLEGESVGPAPDRETIEACVTTLARLHRHLSANFGHVDAPSGSIRQRIAQLKHLMTKGFDEAGVLLDRQAFASNEIREGLIRIVKMARRLAPVAGRMLAPLQDQVFPIRTVLRDVRPNHFLTLGGQIYGLVDFGALGVDVVSLDLARLIGEWLPNVPEALGVVVGSYERIRTLNTQEITAIEPLMTSAAVIGGVAWVDIYGRNRLRTDDLSGMIRAIAHAESRLRIHCDRNSC
jgi:Ser/Thr protein kinase RdoA (MazF antagonist)